MINEASKCYKLPSQITPIAGNKLAFNNMALFEWKHIKCWNLTPSAIFWSRKKINIQGVNMRTECVAPWLSHFPPNAAVHPPASPTLLLASLSIKVCVGCSGGVVEECSAYSDTFATCCVCCTGVVVAEFCCSIRLSVQQHIPGVCAGRHDLSIMLRKEGEVINTHLLPPARPVMRVNLSMSGGGGEAR